MTRPVATGRGVTRKRFRQLLHAVRALVMAALAASACVQAEPQPPAACRGESGAAATTGPHELDAADVRAAALPLDDLGAPYATFVFDSLGGFETNDQRARKTAKAEAPAIARGGRLLGYHAMYHPPPPDFSGPVERIYTLVGVFPDAAGASEHFAALPAGAAKDLSGIGDEAKTYRGSEGRATQTRAFVRRDRLVGSVGINRVDDLDVEAEAIALARKLDDRLRRVLSGETRGYTGPPGAEFRAERLPSMVIPLAELGAPVAGWRRHPGSGGFDDNDDRLALGSINGHERDDELREFNECGRVTGWSELAFEPPPPAPPGTASVSSGTWVMTSAHLFAGTQGATDYVARFVGREKRMKGSTVEGPQARQIEEVVEIPSAASLGESMAASDMTIEGLHRVVVLVRRGRVVGETMVVRRDGSQARSEALDLARRLDARIAGVLAGR